MRKPLLPIRYGFLVFVLLAAVIVIYGWSIGAPGPQVAAAAAPVLIVGWMAMAFIWWFDRRTSRSSARRSAGADDAGME
ncbi:hypothetical protein [Aeromicrobium halocynthiae]|uniref:hypothetical protein n=1 Tax=Aeromicrobium halocynthiae TaxID=560557 RepID=UPI0031E3CB76